MSDDKQSAGPEEEFTDKELAAAKQFAAEVDGSILGRGAPAVMETEARELLQLSTIIHSAYQDAPLDDDRHASIIEAALAQAVGADTHENLIDLDSARAPKRPSWPIVLGLFVAAAAAALFFFQPNRASQETTPSIVVRELPSHEMSRSSGELVGPIDASQSNLASSRLDLIYGDRMLGYRALHYRRLVGAQ